MPSSSGYLKTLSCTIAGSLVIYLGFLSLLAVPILQDHAIYLHRVTLTWFKDINVPEQWGFLQNQVTPFQLQTPDGETLQAWHILPLDVYQRNEAALRAEPTGLVDDIEERLSFVLLKNDPTARLVIYFHGAAGTLGSGWRPQSYRALSAATSNLHVLAIDYRGFGSSTGWPSEHGLLTDALALADFAMNTAGISADRITVFAQSLGTALAISLSHDLALRSPPVLFASTVLVAPIADVETTTQTYKIAGTIPMLSPIACWPPLLAFFNEFIISKWPSKVKLGDMIRHLDTVENSGDRKSYDITIIHAEDDWDIPWAHSDILFSHALRAMQPNETVTQEELEMQKENKIVSLGAGGWEVEWSGKNGVVREQIVKYGLHDRIMSYPVVSLAIARAATNARA